MSVSNTDNEKLLQLRDVSVFYGGVRALDGVSMSLDEGEVIALMGPNGAGKSTVLKAVFGLSPLSSGEVCWYERPFTPVPHRVVRRGIAFVPQGRRVFTHLTVEENLEIGGVVVSDRILLKRRIDEVMDLFPVLRQKRKLPSGSLSGGQQQMVALARGLMTDPKVLLLDEPSLGLAPKVVKEVFGKIKEINRNRGTAIMVVEHNIASLLSIADRAYVLDKGKVVVEDAAKNLIGSSVLEDVFLGKV